MPSPRLNQWFAQFERWFTIALVMYHTNFLYLILSGRLSSEDPMSIRTVLLESSPLLALLKAIILLGLVAVCLLRGRLLISVLLQRKALLGLLLWIIASASWSRNSGDSLKWAFELCTVTIGGFYCAARFSIREFMGLATIGMGLMVGINFLFCLAFPGFGIQNGLQAGAWRGLYIQKNTLARMMLFSAVLFISQLLVSRSPDGPPTYRRWTQVSLFLCVLLTALSQSKTALLLTIGIMLLVPVCQGVRSRHPAALAFLLCGALAGAIVLLIFLGNFEAILTALGRDPTLSGRTDIWEVMVDKIMERPWTGYGYAGFWHGKEGESIDVWYRSRDMPPHGHNGYLDLTLDLGFIGLGLFLSSLGQALIRSIAWLRQASQGEAVFPVLFLITMVFYNISEDSLIAEPSYNLTWFVYSYITSAILVYPIAAATSDLSSDASFEVSSNDAVEYFVTDTSPSLHRR